MDASVDVMTEIALPADREASREAERIYRLRFCLKMKTNRGSLVDIISIMRGPTTGMPWLLGIAGAMVLVTLFLGHLV